MYIINVHLEKTGEKIWQFDITTGMGTRSGLEAVAFTKDGGFIVGGFSHKEDEEWPNYKSGGAIDSGKPILIKYSKAIAESSSVSSSK